MKKTFFKNLFRDIKNTPSRFISIVVIIAVGVAFYSGVRTTSPAMKTSADHYFEEKNLMDFEMISTLGVTEDDIEAVKKQEHIKNVKGSYSLDAVVEKDDKQLVLNVNSLPDLDGMNDIEIVDGRRSENSDEIVVEEYFMKENNLKINDFITLDSGNDDNIKDDLEINKFKIVGKANSPLYLSQQRQISSLGNGDVRGFVYILPEVFKSDVYTEIYATTDIIESKDSLVENETYKSKTKNIEKDLEELGKNRNEVRYEEVYKEAEDKIIEGEEELEESKVEAEEEIADGYKEIEDAQIEIDNGNQELEDSEQILNNEIANGKKELEDGRAEINSAQDEITNAKKELEDGRTEINSAQDEIANGRKELEDGRAEINSGQEEIANNRKKLEDGRAEIKPAQDKIANGRKELEDGRSEIKLAQDEIANKREEIKNAKPQIEQGRKKLNESEAELNQGKQETANQINSNLAEQVKQAEELMKSDPENEEYIVQYQSIKGLYESSIKDKNFDQMYNSLESNDQLPVINQFVDMDKLKSDFSQAEAEIQGGRAELDKQEANIKQGETELANAEEQIEASKQEIEQSETELANAEEQIEASEQEIEQGETELANAEEQIEASKQEIEQGETELANAEAQIEASKQEIEQGEIELANAEEQIEASKQEIEQGEIELENARQESEKELANARIELQNAQKEVDENLEKIQTEEEKANKEIEDAEKKIRKNRNKLKDIEDPEWYVLGRSQNLGYETYRQDSDRIDNIGKVFPLIFFLVAALVSLTTMTRMVQENRTEIGTFKALGYSSMAITSHYLIYSLISSIVGSIIGALIGFRIFPPLIMEAYSSLYSVPVVITPFITSLAVLASILAILFTTLAAGFAVREELREVPAMLMRPKPPKAGKKIFLEKISFIWDRLKFTSKVTARNIFRYKQRLFMTVIGIAACTGLMLTGFGLKDGIIGATEAQFNDIYKYDMQVTLDGDKTENEKNEIKKEALKDKNVEKVLFAKSDNGTIKSEGERSEDAYIVVPENKKELNEYIELYLKDENLELKDDGVIITEKLSRLVNKKIGDTIEITIDDRVVEAEIADITEQYMEHYVYMSPTYYEKIMNEDVFYNDFYGVLKDVSDDTENDTSKRLRSIDGVNSLSFKTNQKVDYDESMESIDAVVIILIVSAGVLAFVVIYNLTNINITERRRELATIKLLGFYNKELAAYIYRENVILTFLGSFAGLFMGMILNRFVLLTAETNLIKFLVKISPRHYVYAVLLTLLFSAIVNLAMYKRFDKIDMIESLKSSE